MSASARALYNSVLCDGGWGGGGRAVAQLARDCACVRLMVVRSDQSPRSQPLELT